MSLVRTSRWALLLALAADACWGQGASQFRPDYLLQGSNLAGWQAVAGPRWTASNGELTSAASGWLFGERRLQDAGFFSSFHCAGACATGVMLRTPEDIRRLAGTVCLAGCQRSGHLSGDAGCQGRETAREPLRQVRGQIRFAPPPHPPRARARRRWRRPGGQGGQPPALKAGEWNQVQIALDADVLRVWVNDMQLPMVATNDQSEGYRSHRAEGCRRALVFVKSAWRTWPCVRYRRRSSRRISASSRSATCTTAGRRWLRISTRTG